MENLKIRAAINTVIYIKTPTEKRFHVYNPYKQTYGMPLVYAPRFTIDDAKKAVEWLQNAAPECKFEYRRIQK